EYPAEIINDAFDQNSQAKQYSDKIILENDSEEFIILAKDRVENAFANFRGVAEYEIVEEMKGKDLVGLSYTPLFDFYRSSEKDHKIYEFEGMANTDDGVGIVHSAPGFGEIDTQMGEHYGLTMSFSVNDEGKFTDEVKNWAGQYIKDADPYIIQELFRRNLMFKSERIDHRYPYCYRCHTPLIHRAQNSWYIKVSAIKDDMLESNEKINWVPEHFKHGRFKKGIETAPDWGISRTRYWATPMPVWRDEKGEETVVIGSRDELRKLANEPITKLILVNSNEKTTLEGEITDKGWEDARKLEDEFDGEVDVFISADTTRSQEMLKPLARTENSEKEILKNSVFGNEELDKNFSARVKSILNNKNISNISDLSEKELEEEFGDDMQYIKIELEKILKEYEGKAIMISTLPHIIAVIDHLVSEKKLRVTFRTYPNPGETKVFFMDGLKQFDLHKPYIDKFTIKSPKTGNILKRIFEVCDVWMDSGSMPYAMAHYPFEDKKDFEDNFPADFIVEYVAQTRAWFYVMHVISTALMNKNSFKNVVTTGVMAGTDGRKMSKSYGNYPDPKATIEKYGADPLRLYFMGSKIMVAEDIAFSEDQIKEQIKTIILPLWNSFSFFVTYANQGDWKPSPSLVQKKTDEENWNKIPFEVKDKLNIWILSKLQMTIMNIRAAMEDYNLPK
ncbi:MAG TPA: class I tRNA ligase family protein, partial [Candidatus Dojkabacteria bacterium]